MQYETILLELLSRIKSLESEVEQLKQKLEACSRPVSPTPSEEGEQPSAGYQKMTDDMIDRCYQEGKRLQEGANVQQLANVVAQQTGMNRNSAIMYLHAVDGMLSGTVYKRAISAKATQRYFDWILKEFGSVGLKQAIRSTRLHIQYRKACGHKVESIEALCDRQETRL